MKCYTLPWPRCETGLRARLLLEDGTCVEGCGFGAASVRTGEVVFSTSMQGYTEALTDPSYAGQILLWTHPMVGCYGVPSPGHAIDSVPIAYESDRAQVEGFIVSELPPPHHYASISDLHTWLAREGVPGLYRVDTRALVKKIRERGVMMGVLAVYPEREEIGWEELERALRSSDRYDNRDLVTKVSPRRPVLHEPGPGAVATVHVLDCGLKYGILREMLKRGLRVVRMPCWSGAGDLLEGSDGVVISNGPGNPEILTRQVEVVRELVYSGRPVLGVCLGNQLIALSLGARVYKLRYGHRGPNKGVVDIASKRSYITTQNHGYAVDEDSLVDTGLEVWFRNIDDRSIEGLRHKRLPVVATQFHPEGGPGPRDTTWVFDMFIELIKRGGRGLW